MKLFLLIAVVILTVPTQAQVLGGQGSIGGVASLGGTGGVIVNTYSFLSATTQQACTTPCAVTISSTISGGLIVIDATTSAASSYITNATAGVCNVSWVFPTTSHATDSGNGISSSYAYCPNSVSGQTSITSTLGSNGTVRIWQFSSTSAPVFDQCGILVTSSAAMSQLGVGFTLASPKETILQVAISPQTINAISSPYGHLATGGRASADSENTSSGTAPTWTLTASGNTTTAACAFK